jgi:flagellar biosynthesis protein FlhF
MYGPILGSHPATPLMLVGMPGAGKTATLAKLAAAAKTAKTPVIAVTCDLAKAGSIDQLATYAKAMGITAYQAKNAATLKRAVEAAPDGALVLIDTAGVNPLKHDELAALAELAATVRAEPILTLAAGCDVSEAAEQGQLFAEIGCLRMIATRIDAARRYGALLAAAESGKLAFAEFGVSPEIATGLMMFGADALARLIMPQEIALQANAPEEITRGEVARNAKSAQNGGLESRLGEARVSFGRAAAGASTGASPAGTNTTGAGGTRRKPSGSKA